MIIIVSSCNILFIFACRARRDKNRTLNKLLGATKGWRWKVHEFHDVYYTFLVYPPTRGSKLRSPLFPKHVMCALEPQSKRFKKHNPSPRTSIHILLLLLLQSSRTDLPSSTTYHYYYLPPIVVVASCFHSIPFYLPSLLL